MVKNRNREHIPAVCKCSLTFKHTLMNLHSTAVFEFIEYEKRFGSTSSYIGRSTSDSPMFNVQRQRSAFSPLPAVTYRLWESNRRRKRNIRECRPQTLRKGLLIHLIDHLTKKMSSDPSTAEIHDDLPLLQNSYLQRKPQHISVFGLPVNE